MTTFTAAEMLHIRRDPVILLRLADHHETQAVVARRQGRRQVLQFHTSRAKELRREAAELVC